MPYKYIIQLSPDKIQGGVFNVCIPCLIKVQQKFKDPDLLWYKVQPCYIAIQKHFRVNKTWKSEMVISVIYSLHCNSEEREVTEIDSAS